MSFSHLDPGTAESVWAAALSARPVGDAPAFDRLVVVSAHPDDETLGVGGLMNLAHRRGAPIALVVVTDGENSHPASPTTTPDDLRRMRRAEVETAVSHLAPDADVHFLGVADGGIEERRDDVTAALLDIVGSDDRPTLVVSTWTGDGHRDHRIVGEIAQRAAALCDAAHRAYPIWLWHWATPDDAPWERMELVSLDERARAAKHAAAASHPSQTAALSQQPGDEPILHAGMLEHFARPFEVLVDVSSSTPQGHFDRFYAGADDPWGFDTRWYEARKRAVLLAALPRPRYAAVLELGCATGALTVELAPRADELLAVDFAATALETARGRTARHPQVALRRATLPAEWPEGAFDLIVFSEIGYYWGAADLRAAIERMRGSLRPGGHLVACHWRHPVPDGPLDGDAVHAALRTAPGLEGLVHHREDDFVLDVLGAPTAAPPAREPRTVAGAAP